MTPRSLALSFGFLAACAFGAVPARAASPAADYKIEADYREKSPDGQTIIEQYHKEDSDGEWHWQFWARRGNIARRRPSACAEAIQKSGAEHRLPDCCEPPSAVCQ